MINDCDGADEYDQDGDGFDGGEGGTDCDDNNSDIHPGAEDIADDGIDQDCDGEDTVTVDTGLDSGLAGDTGLDGGTYKGGGCKGCASATPAGGVALLGLLGLALLGRRRGH